MNWARIMVPLCGNTSDASVLKSAASIAKLFKAELAAVYTPSDIADIMPWMGEGFMGGVQIGAVESLQQAIQEGELNARAAVEAIDYDRKAVVTIASPVWLGLSTECRLSDLVVFDDHAARGKGALAESFQQVVVDEQRPVLVVRAGLTGTGIAAIAWDGGKESSRAVRTALPLLDKASKVVILAAPTESPRPYDPSRLEAFLAARGIASEIMKVKIGDEPAPLLLAAAKSIGAELMVAGAFGHPRLQEFVFGGATRSFLNADGPSLFLSH